MPITWVPQCTGDIVWMYCHPIAQQYSMPCQTRCFKSLVLLSVISMFIPKNPSQVIRNHQHSCWPKKLEDSHESVRKNTFCKLEILQALTSRGHSGAAHNARHSPHIASWRNPGSRQGDGMVSSQGAWAGQRLFPDYAAGLQFRPV